jgi:WD40 repeat protein
MLFFQFFCAILFFLFTATFIEATDTRPELVLQTGHTGSILTLAISPDGRWLVSGGQDSTVKIWDLKSGNLLRTLYGHNAKISSVAISPDGRYIASSADDGTARLWDVYGGQGMRDLSGHTRLISSVAFASGGAQVLTASADVIRIWETSTGKELRSIRIPVKDQEGRCTLSADG